MKKQSFLYGSLILVMSAAIAKIIGALFKIPLTNMLGGTGMGYFSCAYGVFLPIYAVTVTGLPTAAAKLTAENSAFRRYANIRRIKKLSILFFSLMGLVASLALSLLSYPLSAYIIGNEDAFPSVLAIAPSIFFGCMMSAYRGYYEGLRNMYPTALSQVAEALTKLAAGLFLCKLTIDTANFNPQRLCSAINRIGIFGEYTERSIVESTPVFAAAAAVFGITLSTAAGTLFLILRDRIIGDGITAGEISSSPGTDRSGRILRSLAATASAVAAGSLVTNLTSLIDLGSIMHLLERAISTSEGALTGALSAEDATATANFIYGSFTGLAVTVFNLVPSITNMLGKSALPSLSEAWASGNLKRVQSSAEKVIRATGLVAMPSGFGIAAMSRPILEALFSGSKAEISIAAAPLSMLAPGVICLCISSAVFAMLQAIGRADIPIKLMLIGVAVKLAGNILLIPIPVVNIGGAAISTSLSYAVIAALSVSALGKAMGLRLPVRRILLPQCYSAILCAAGAFAAHRMAGSILPATAATVISIAFGGIIYIFGLLFSGGLNKNIVKELFG